MSVQQDSNGSSSAPTSKYHWYHRHGDIRIKALGGTILMADSWRLARASKVFADMMEVSKPKNESNSETGESEDPNSTKRKREDDSQSIELEYTSKVLAHFLDLANQAYPTPPASTYEDTKKLYDLCEQFDTIDSIKATILSRLSTTGHKRQWDLLVFAGKKDDLNLAAIALRAMDSTTFAAQKVQSEPKGAILHGLDFWARMSYLPLRWQIELMRKATVAPAQVQNRTYNGNPLGPVKFSLDITEYWNSVAANFDPEDNKRTVQATNPPSA